MAIAGEKGGVAVSARLAKVTASAADAHAALTEGEIVSYNTPPTVLPEEMMSASAVAAMAAADTGLVAVSKGEEKKEKKPSILVRMSPCFCAHPPAPGPPRACEPARAG